jgi:hypothetical protein
MRFLNFVIPLSSNPENKNVTSAQKPNIVLNFKPKFERESFGVRSQIFESISRKISSPKIHRRSERGEKQSLLKRNNCYRSRQNRPQRLANALRYKDRVEMNPMDSDFSFLVRRVRDRDICCWGQRTVSTERGVIGSKASSENLQSMKCDVSKNRSKPQIDLTPAGQSKGV